MYSYLQVIKLVKSLDTMASWGGVKAIDLHDDKKKHGEKRKQHILRAMMT